MEVNLKHMLTKKKNGEEFSDRLFDLFRRKCGDEMDWHSHRV